MSEEAAAVDAEDCDLGWSILMLRRGYADRVEPVFEGFPRGARGYQLLYTVVRKRIRTQIALADYLGVDRSVLPYVIDDLVEAGLVTRTNDPADRRVRTVVPTEAGRELCARTSREVEEAEQRMLDALGAAEAEQLRSLLGVVARDVRDDD